MQQIKVVLLGDERLCSEVKAATVGRNFTVLTPPEGAALDEWQLRRWFSTVLPDWTCICVGMKAQTSSSDFLATVKGSLLGLECSLGFSAHVRLISHWPTAEFFLLRRFCELMRLEKKADYLEVIGTKGLHLAESLVLHMQNVSSKKEDTGVQESDLEGGQVRDAMVPEHPGGTEKRQVAGSLQGMLEVPLAKAEGVQSGDLCAEQYPAAREAAGD